MSIFSHIQRLPWMVPSFLLTLAASLSQGFGLAMFAPLFKIVTKNPDTLEPPFTYVRDILSVLDLPFNITAVLILVVGANIFGLALTFAQRALVMGLAWTQFVEATSARLIDALLAASWHHAAAQATGSVVNDLVNEVRRAGRAVTHLVIGAAAGLQVAVFLALSIVLSWRLMLLVAVFGIAAMMAVRPLQRRALGLGHDLTEANDRFAFVTVDYLQNFKLVKATGAESRIADLLNGLQRAVCRVLFSRQINLAGSLFVVQSVSVLLISVIIWFSHSVLALDTAILLTVLIFLARMVPLMTQLQQEYQAYILDRSSIEAVDREIAKHRAEREQTPADAKPFKALRSEIVFDNVSYTFPDANTPAVNGLSFTIKRGTMVALVGESGGGKSTVVDLLCGLRSPTDGQITVDGTSLRTINQESWRHRIGYVTQDIVILNDTLRANLRFAHPSAGEADMRQAITAAALDDVIGGLPEKFDSLLGENGVRLSGGQKQRLALARALIGKPELLLLDEATSALDNESERLVQNAIDSLAHKFTMVVVAHRLSTVRKADLICVLERGRILERGTYDELRAMGGKFAQLHDHQFETTAG